MPATTEDTVEEAIRAILVATPPRYPVGQSRVWKQHVEELSTVRDDARWFRFSWDHHGHTPGGFMGPAQVETSFTLSIFVDYGGVPEQVVKKMAGDDHDQLRDVFNRLKSTVDGLRWIASVGGDNPWDFANSDRNNARIVHQFTVRFMKARA